MKSIMKIAASLAATLTIITSALAYEDSGMLIGQGKDSGISGGVMCFDAPAQVDTPYALTDAIYALEEQLTASRAAQLREFQDTCILHSLELAQISANALKTLAEIFKLGKGCMLIGNFEKNIIPTLLAHHANGIIHSGCHSEMDLSPIHAFRDSFYKAHQEFKAPLTIDGYLELNFDDNQIDEIITGLKNYIKELDSLITHHS